MCFVILIMTILSFPLCSCPLNPAYSFFKTYLSQNKHRENGMIVVLTKSSNPFNEGATLIFFSSPFLGQMFYSISVPCWYQRCFCLLNSPSLSSALNRKWFHSLRSNLFGSLGIRPPAVLQDAVTTHTAAAFIFHSNSFMWKGNWEVINCWIWWQSSHADWC